MHIVDSQFLLLDEFSQVKTKRLNVLAQFFRRLLERYEHTRFVIFHRAADEKLHGEQRFPAARAPAHQRRAALREPSLRDFVQTCDSCGAFGQSNSSALFGFPFLSHHAHAKPSDCSFSRPSSACANPNVVINLQGPVPPL